MDADVERDLRRLQTPYAAASVHPGGAAVRGRAQRRGTAGSAAPQGGLSGGQSGRPGVTDVAAG